MLARPPFPRSLSWLYSLLYLTTYSILFRTCSLTANFKAVVLALAVSSSGNLSVSVLQWLTLTHTHTRLTALCPGQPRWAATREVKPIWILLKQDTVGGSGISWAICKSAPRSRQTTTPTPHHSFFTGRMPFLPPNQQRQSTEALKHWHSLSLAGRAANDSVINYWWLVKQHSTCCCCNWLTHSPPSRSPHAVFVIGQAAAATIDTQNTVELCRRVV